MENKNISNTLKDEEGLNLRFDLVKSEDGKFHFTAISGEKIYGQSTLNPIREQSDLINIESIYVIPEVRGAGIGSELLDFMEKTIKRAGFNGIFAKASGDSSFLYPINSFLKEAGYICSGYQSYISKYSVDEILNSRFKEILDKLESHKSIKNLDDIPPNMIKAIREKEGVFIDNTGKYSKTLSKVAVNNEHITAIALCDSGDDMFLVKDILILPENKDKGVLMHILCSIVLEAQKQGLSNILLRTGTNHIEEGFFQCMVFPKSKEYEQEFIKVL